MTEKVDEEWLFAMKISHKPLSFMVGSGRVATWFILDKGKGKRK